MVVFDSWHEERLRDIMKTLMIMMGGMERRIGSISHVPKMDACEVF